MWTLEQKQLYFKEHVPQDQREEFQGYIEDEVGNEDIEKWSNDFIVRLVNRFKQKKEEESGGQTSFYQYQANQQPQSPTSLDNILASLTHQTQPISSPPPPRKEQKKQSAFALLDSIFKKKHQQPPSAENTIDHHNFKTGPVNMKIEKEQTNPSAFASNQFWDMGSKGHKMTKATADFASFDFWSQPSSVTSSPQNSKITTNFDTFSEHSSKKKEEEISKNLQEKLPSFDQLLVNYHKEKGPSPYTKKTNPDEIEIEKINDEKLEKLPKEKEEKTKPISKSVEKRVSKSKPGKVLYDGEIIIKHEFQSSVKCFPAIERDRLKNPDLRAVFEGHQIVQRTFLMPDYAMYHIKIIPLDILIKRNYEDFSKLRLTLQKLFPGIKLAYLESNSWFSKTNADFISNQKVMLQFFLNDLIMNREIRNSRILQDFLTLPDHKKIKRRFQEWEKLQAPKGVQDLCLLGGKIDITLSEQQRLYHENFKRYNSKMIDFLDRQQRLTQTLLEQYKQLDFTQNELANLMKSMIEETIYFNERVYDLEMSKMDESLKVIHRCLVEENKITKFNIDTISEMILPFVKYEKENMAEMEELIELEQSFFKSYLRRSTIEKTEEGMPYTSDKIKHLKEGVLKESSNILVFKYQTGFLSNQLCQEGHRVIETLAQKYLRLYRDYSRKCKNKCALMLQYWTSESCAGV